MTVGSEPTKLLKENTQESPHGGLGDGPFDKITEDGWWTQTQASGECETKITAAKMTICIATGMIYRVAGNPGGRERIFAIPMSKNEFTANIRKGCLTWCRSYKTGCLPDASARLIPCV